LRAFFQATIDRRRPIPAAMNEFTASAPIALVLVAVFLGWLRWHLVRREQPDLRREVARAIRQANDDFTDD
jgi:hypothetical protein